MAENGRKSWWERPAPQALGRPAYVSLAISQTDAIEIRPKGTRAGSPAAQQEHIPPVGKVRWWCPVGRMQTVC